MQCNIAYIRTYIVQFKPDSGPVYETHNLVMLRPHLSFIRIFYVKHTRGSEPDHLLPNGALGEFLTC